MVLSLFERIYKLQTQTTILLLVLSGFQCANVSTNVRMVYDPFKEKKHTHTKKNYIVYNFLRNFH